MRAFVLPAVLAVLLPFASPGHAENSSEEARLSLMAADTAFSEAVDRRDRETFADMISEKALFLGGSPHHGRAEVVEAWKRYFEPDRKATLSWKPARADAAASGDLGYTVGNYVLRTIDDSGSVSVKHGVYVTVWRKESDGRWRAVLDTGTPPGATPVEIPGD